MKSEKNKIYLNACKTVFDGPVCGPAGAFNFNNKTLTILHKNNKFSSIDKQTGATKIFENRLSFIQHLFFFMQKKKENYYNKYLIYGCRQK
jgi:hypothetical protein